MMLQELVLLRHLPREQGLRPPQAANLLHGMYIQIGLAGVDRRRRGTEDVPDSSRNRMQTESQFTR